MIVLISILPLLVIAAHYLIDQDPVPVLAFGDHALLELGTLKASQGKQLLGPYSRFQWNHPGPMLFYVFVPFYLLCHHSVVGIHLAALCLNLICFFFMYRMTKRSESRYQCSCLVLLFTFFLVYTGHEFFVTPLNPLVTVMPFGCLLFLLALLASGYLAYLPIVVLFGSLLVQSHIGYAMTVAVLGLFTLLLIALTPFLNTSKPGQRMQPGSKRWAWLLLGSTLLAVLLWLPTMIEQYSSQHGNVTKLALFFSEGGRKHELGEAIYHLARQLSFVPLQLLTYLGFNNLSPRTNSICLIFSGMQLIGLAWTAIIAFRRNWSITQNQAFIALLGLFSGLIALLSIEGVVRDYLIQWLSMLGLFNLTIILGVMIEYALEKIRTDRHKCVINTMGVLWGLMITAMIGLYLGSINLRLPHDPNESRTIQNIYTVIKQKIEQNGPTRVYLDIRILEQWPFVAGVVVQLQKDSIPLSVNENWLYMFGPDYEPQDDETLGFIFGDQLLSRKLKDVPGVELIYNRDGFMVFSVQSDDAQLLIF